MGDYSLLKAEFRELEDDLRNVFSELNARSDPGRRAYSGGEFQPPVDVVETGTAVEVLVDLAGVPADAIRVIFRRNVLLVAGEKSPGPAAVAPTFHLIEREFGRFARAVRLSGAFDIAQANASLSAGELRIVLPRQAERRDQPHQIPVSAGPSAPA